MKSAISTKLQKDEYPCLKSKGELIVLFIEKDTGVVVHPGPAHRLGMYGESWIESNFAPFNDSVILSS